jgi:hypothetical protein
LVGRSGDEGLPPLLTPSSGVKEFSTIHARSARQALTWLRNGGPTEQRAPAPLPERDKGWSLLRAAVRSAGSM